MIETALRYSDVYWGDEVHSRMTRLTTISGIDVDLIAPTPEMFCIEDIAWSLSMQSRAVGHFQAHPEADWAYNNAQHSILVSMLLEGTPYQLTGLLHDATEAYLSDIFGPIKKLFPEYQAAERRLWRAIAVRFGLPLDLPERVHWADAQAFQYEWTTYAHPLVPRQTMEIRTSALDFVENCLSPSESRRLFLDLFHLYRRAA